jgi:putative ABC transport system permease protein
MQNGIKVTPEGTETCDSTGCHKVTKDTTFDTLGSPSYGTLDASAVASVARLSGVSAAAGGLVLTDTQLTLSATSAPAAPNTFTVDGVDLAHPGLGPLSAGTTSSGRGLKPSDATANAAVVDSNYATSKGLRVGSTVKVGGVPFTVVGIVTQPQGSNPPQVYVPLARAQALARGADGAALTGRLNTIYVTAASADRITAVRREIGRLLPSATVTTSAGLADQVTGSLASTAKLADVLGRWLSVLVLIAAFAVAALLMMAAVSRRVREFGTLKALGWRTRRIIAQVMGESLAIGVLGGALGVGLGFAGTAVITAVAPKLTATVTTSTGMRTMTMGPAGAQGSTPTEAHTVAVPLTAAVSGQAVLLAVLLAVVGGLVAGAFASWRIGRLRPADALARIS